MILTWLERPLSRESLEYERLSFFSGDQLGVLLLPLLEAELSKSLSSVNLPPRFECLESAESTEPDSLRDLLPKSASYWVSESLLPSA